MSNSTTTPNAARDAGQWFPNGYGRHSRKVGTLELLAPHTFLQYGSHAADTDWVACEPQTVDLMQHGDDYWVCATLAGTLAKTTRTYQVKIGQFEGAFLQTQSCGGIGDWANNPLYRLTITHPELSLQQVSTYADGSPMLALRPL